MANLILLLQAAVTIWSALWVWSKTRGTHRRVLLAIALPSCLVAVMTASCGFVSWANPLRSISTPLLIGLALVGFFVHEALKKKNTTKHRADND